MTETPRPPETAEFGAVKPGGPTHAYEQNGCMRVKKFSLGPFDNNVYVIACGGTNAALIVDCPADAERIVAEAEGLDIVGLVVTHSHPDHVAALPDLVKLLNVPVYCHPNDMPRMTTGARPLHGNETIQVGEVEVDVWHTPGHTPGSLSFIATAPAGEAPHLFSGDTLFPGGPGNTEGKPARFQEVMRSLDRLFTLPDETRVSPGHGVDTFIGRERPHVETWRARGW